MHSIRRSNFLLVVSLSFVITYVRSSALSVEYGSTGRGSTGCGCQSSSWSAAHFLIRFLVPVRAREMGVSRGSAAPSCVSQPAHFPYSSWIVCCLLITGFLPFPATDGVHTLYRQPPSGQSRVYRITQLRTDNVPYQDSAGTGPPLVLNVVRVTGACCLFMFHP